MKRDRSKAFRALMPVAVVLSMAACQDRQQPLSGPSGVPPVVPPVVPPAPPRVVIDARIAFDSNRTGTTAIYVATEDGTAVQRLVNGQRPDWSPDGREIVFEGCLPLCGVHIMAPDGSGLRRVAGGGTPKFSPDGTRLAFTNVAGLVVANRDGSEARVIASHELANPGVPSDYAVEYPKWMPDGRIAFQAGNYIDGANWHTIRPDGTDLQKLAACGFYFSWSPDGTRLVATNYYGLVVGTPPCGREWMVLLPQPPNRLTDLFEPAWTGDGQEVAFSRYDESSGCERPNCPMRLYAIPASGGAPRQIIPDDPTAPSPNYRDDRVTFLRRR